MCKPNLKQCGAEGTIVLECSLRLHTGENAVFFLFLLASTKTNALQVCQQCQGLHFCGISSGMFEHIRAGFSSFKKNIKFH